MRRALGAHLDADPRHLVIAPDRAGKPEVVEPAAAHGEALWGAASDDLVERGVARVQGMVGFDAVRRPVLQGGRSPAVRQALVPWGERAVDLRPLDRPWPGRVPGPAPVRVFAAPPTAEVVDDTGQIAARYDKIHLFDVDLQSGESWRESSVYRAGERAVVVDTPWGGLGLAICKELTHQMGGTLTLQSQYGAGSTFVVRIPFARADVVPDHPVLGREHRLVD